MKNIATDDNYEADICEQISQGGFHLPDEPNSGLEIREEKITEF